MDADGNDDEKKAEQQTTRQRLAQDATSAFEVVGTNGVGHLYGEAHGTG